MKCYLLAFVLIACPALSSANDLSIKFTLYDKAKIKMGNVWVKLLNAPEKFEANKLYKGTWNGEPTVGYYPVKSTNGSSARLRNKSKNDLVVVFETQKSNIPGQSYERLKMFLGINIVEDQIVLYPDNLQTINSSGKWRYETDTGPADAGTYEVVTDY